MLHHKIVFLDLAITDNQEKTYVQIRSIALATACVGIFASSAGQSTQRISVRLISTSSSSFFFLVFLSEIITITSIRTKFSFDVQIYVESQISTIYIYISFLILFKLKNKKII